MPGRRLTNQEKKGIVVFMENPDIQHLCFTAKAGLAANKYQVAIPTIRYVYEAHERRARVGKQERILAERLARARIAREEANNNPRPAHATVATTTPLDFATLARRCDAATPLHATATTTTTTTAHAMGSHTEAIDAPFGRAVAATNSSSKLLATASPPTSKINNAAVHELVLDPDEYERFQQDPYLYLGIDNSVELDIEVIDKRYWRDNNLT